MLSSVARAAIKRLVSTTAPTSLHRIAVSRFALNTPKSNHAFIRGFATPGRPKKATTTTTKKPTATKKPAGKQSKSTKSKTTKPKAADKKKPATRRRKPLSPEQQATLEKRELKKTALFTEPKHLAITPWMVFVTEQSKQKLRGPAELRSNMAQLSQDFKALPASELQRLNTTAEQNKLAYAAAYKAWVESHTPVQISDARRARVLLKKKYNYPSRSVKTIQDDRIPRRPANAFTLYTKARWASGEYANSPIVEGAKAIGQEWKNLAKTERQAYEDLAKSNSEHYAKEVQSVLHRAVQRRPSPQP